MFRAQDGAFEFAVLAALRVKQLMRGCVARVPGNHKAMTIAQLEIATGRVVKLADTDKSPQV